MLIQVLLGVLLVSVQDYEPPRFHMFYGFVAFITVGLLYSYRYVWKARDWMELAYGLGGLFIMGLGHPRRCWSGDCRMTGGRGATSARAAACSAAGRPSTTSRA